MKIDLPEISKESVVTVTKLCVSEGISALAVVAVERLLYVNVRVVIPIVEIPFGQFDWFGVTVLRH